MSQLVLSLFPGIGLLDMAFEEEGFCVVRGPDVLWGGDIQRFHPPAGKFDGVIGGPPCQCHTKFATLNAALGNHLADDLVPEFLRCVTEAEPDWFLMENSPLVYDVATVGFSVQRLTLNARLFGCEQDRERSFQFGSTKPVKIWPEVVCVQAEKREPVCLASEGRAGRITRTGWGKQQKAKYNQRRPWPRFCELQGLPEDFLTDAPFTNAGRYRVVGNGVPLPMGRAIAKAVREATEGHQRVFKPVLDASRPQTDLTRLGYREV